MPDEQPSPEAVSAARDQAFEEIEQVADRAASLARSIGEAAYRGDATATAVHLRQLRECVLSMFKTYKEGVLGNGEDVAKTRVTRSDRPDKRSGDGVARGQLK